MKQVQNCFEWNLKLCTFKNVASVLAVVYVLLGRAVTEYRWGGSRNILFMRHKFLVLTVKKLLKSVYIYRSYRKIKTGLSLFLEHSVHMYIHIYFQPSRIVQNSTYTSWKDTLAIIPFTTARNKKENNANSQYLYLMTIRYNVKLCQNISLLLQRVSIACYAEQSAVLAMIDSDRPSHAGIMPKRLQLRSCGLHWRIAPWF